MENITHLTLTQVVDGLRRGDFSACELMQAYVENVEKSDKLNAFVWKQDQDRLINAAREADERIRSGSARALEGIPLAVKDNYCTKGIPTTACSRMLEHFVPSYEATTTRNLWDSGAVMIGKTNMDEFGMGSSNEHSVFGPAISPWRRSDAPDVDIVPGGSSGGSASAVSGLLCLGATATDTGGSIRQPASFTGTVGVKPTYGRCSRFGLISYASSMDQAGPIARTVKDAALLLREMAGHDAKDSTSVRVPVPDYEKAVDRSIRGLKVGIVTGPYGFRLSESGLALRDRGVEWLKEAGCIVEEVDLPMVPKSLEVYYIIAPAECSSNLARYDGVRYGYRSPEARTLEDVYVLSRTQGFGEEVKRRIMTGTYVLSTGHANEFFRGATQIRRLISDDFRHAFEKVDAILTPTTPYPAFARGTKADPLEMYANDVMTVPANLAGLPAISVPGSLSEDGLPIGLQLIGRPFEEEILFALAGVLEKSSGMCRCLLSLDRWWE